MLPRCRSGPPEPVDADLEIRLREMGEVEWQALYEESDVTVAGVSDLSRWPRGLWE